MLCSRYFLPTWCNYLHLLTLCNQISNSWFEKNLSKLGGLFSLDNHFSFLKMDMKKWSYLFVVALPNKIIEKFPFLQHKVMRSNILTASNTRESSSLGSADSSQNLLQVQHPLREKFTCKFSKYTFYFLIALLWTKLTYTLIHEYFGLWLELKH